jgi:hypothetical protein
VNTPVNFTASIWSLGATTASIWSSSAATASIWSSSAVTASIWSSGVSFSHCHRCRLDLRTGLLDFVGSIGSCGRGSSSGSTGAQLPLDEPVAATAPGSIGIAPLLGSIYFLAGFSSGLAQLSVNAARLDSPSARFSSARRQIGLGLFDLCKKKRKRGYCFPVYFIWLTPLCRLYDGTVGTQKKLSAPLFVFAFTITCRYCSCALAVVMGSSSTSSGLVPVLRCPVLFNDSMTPTIVTGFLACVCTCVDFNFGIFSQASFPTRRLLRCLFSL